MMEKALEFLKQSGVFYLATVEGDQPRVRPFGAVCGFEGKLYLITANTKPVFAQLTKNPRAEISSMTDREEIFHEVLGPDAHIYHLPFNITEADADAVAEEVIRKGTDGLVMASNVPSVAVLKALFRRGVRIQEDIRIVSFDYSNVYNFFTPSITYIQQPLPQIAEQAGKYLFRLIDMKDAGEDISTVKDKIILKATLV